MNLTVICVSSAVGSDAILASKGRRHTGVTADQYLAVTELMTVSKSIAMIPN